MIGSVHAPTPEGVIADFLFTGLNLVGNENRHRHSRGRRSPPSPDFSGAQPERPKRRRRRNADRHHTNHERPDSRHSPAALRDLHHVRPGAAAGPASAPA
ncbi:unnamed protein product [Didymodactylos carnosus]|uniref:Uncharacterized protein n=1 Tax=Didymodactylos carnosus TaxID=1234261 RepID=A0A816GZD4_9BILA|nr:unnamed protein product [Didymodactylos carnosus]CAF4684724.1 unnamed protein product [Didymodactylos carnosus]